MPHVDDLLAETLIAAAHAFVAALEAALGEGPRPPPKRKPPAGGPAHQNAVNVARAKEAAAATLRAKAAITAALPPGEATPRTRRELIALGGEGKRPAERAIQLLLSEGWLRPQGNGFIRSPSRLSALVAAAAPQSVRTP